MLPTFLEPLFKGSGEHHLFGFWLMFFVFFFVFSIPFCPRILNHTAAGSPKLRRALFNPGRLSFRRNSTRRNSTVISASAMPSTLQNWSVSQHTSASTEERGEVDPPVQGLADDDQIDHLFAQLQILDVSVTKLVKTMDEIVQEFNNSEDILDMLMQGIMLLEKIHMQGQDVLEVVTCGFAKLLSSSHGVRLPSSDQPQVKLESVARSLQTSLSQLLPTLQRFIHEFRQLLAHHKRRSRVGSASLGARAVETDTPQQLLERSEAMLPWTRTAVGKLADHIYTLDRRRTQAREADMRADLSAEWDVVSSTLDTP
eukprot:m.163377 g.163377  ORF g.163377 m.163377 type:complete len:313 (+) comp21034_c1_seq2:447-1385(+)